MYRLFETYHLKSKYKELNSKLDSINKIVCSDIKAIIISGTNSKDLKYWVRGKKIEDTLENTIWIADLDKENIKKKILEIELILNERWEKWRK